MQGLTAYRENPLLHAIRHSLHGAVQLQIIITCLLRLYFCFIISDLKFKCNSSLPFFYRFKLDISSLPYRFKLYLRIFAVSLKAYNRRVVLFFRLLNGIYSFAVVLFLKGFALKHKIITFRQAYYVKTLRNSTVVIFGYFNALNVNRSAGFAVFFRQPQAYGIAAERIHAHKSSPYIAAHFFTVGEILLRFHSTLDDYLSCRFAYLLNKNVSYIFHSQIFLSQFSDFYSIRNEKSYGNGIFCIFSGISAALPILTALTCGYNQTA